MSKSGKALDAPLLQWSDFEALEGDFNLLAGEILTGSIPAIWRVLLQNVANTELVRIL